MGCFTLPKDPRHQLTPLSRALHANDDYPARTGGTQSGGSFGTGSRIKLHYTRAIIDAIHSGALGSVPTQPDPVFGFEVVPHCQGVPSECLRPENTWAD